MIFVTPKISIEEKELQEDFIHAGGPGGQHVNKVATAVQLRFKVQACSALNRDAKQRLARLAGRRMTAEGELVITARRYRLQERNRLDARERLAGLIRKALDKPKPRKSTVPTQASRQRRLEAKRRRGQDKKLRASVQAEGE
jgi:ribosome-associated protein